MKNSLETRLGIFFALAMIAAVLLIETVGGANFFRRGYELYAYFTTIQELKVGDPVRMAGVRVGSVSDFVLTNDQVRVTLKLDRGRTVRTDSKARIKFTGLLGQNYVDVDFGSPGGLAAEPGATLDSVEQPDLNQIMARLENVAKGVENVAASFSGDSFQNVLGPLADFMRDNNAKLGAIFGNLQLISENIVEGRGTVGRLVNEDELYREALATVENLGASADAITALLDDAQEVMASAKSAVNGINEGKGTLGLLAKDEALYRESTVAMENLREILQKINQGQGSVGKLVNEEAFLSTLKLTLQKVEKATDSLEDQGPLSVIGLAVGSLF